MLESLTALPEIVPQPGQAKPKVIYLIACALQPVTHRPLANQAGFQISVVNFGQMGHLRSL